MPINYSKRSVRLHGVITVDDAEEVHAWLRENPRARMNMTQCTHMHTAVLQVLISVRPEISAWPEAEDIRDFLHNTLPVKN